MQIRGRFSPYFLESLVQALDILDVDALGIKTLRATRLNSRARWDPVDRAVLMDPTTKSFQLGYKGYCRKFGGVADLTPGGVFLHEAGHALTFRHRSLLKTFRKIRKAERKSITSYGTKYVGEDIAECFRLYCSNPAKLQAIKPMRFEAIDKYGLSYIL